MAYDLGSWLDSGNGMGLLAGASTGANLGAGIYSAMAKAAEQRRLESLMKAGPDINRYYQPMSAAEAAGFGRGVMQNYQQAVPPGAYLDSLMGENMAKRESERFADAQRMAYGDWAQRLAGRQFAAGQQPGMPQNVGAPLAQYMLLRQIQAARQRAEQPPPGATAPLNQYGASVGGYQLNPRPGMTDPWQQGMSLYNPQVRSNVDTFNISPNVTGFQGLDDTWAGLGTGPEL